MDDSFEESVSAGQADGLQEIDPKDGGDCGVGSKGSKPLVVIEG